MKVSKTIGGYYVEVDADNIKEVVESFSDVSEILHAAEKCEACGGKHTRFQLRHSSGYKFYEVVCMNSKCRARLSLGQPKEGSGLFPARRDKNGEVRGKWGWEVYQRDGDEGGSNGEHESYPHDNSHVDEPPSSENAGWRNHVVPFGGNKGKTVGSLSPEVILGYVEHYDNNPPKTVEARLLHVVCRTALKEFEASLAASGDDIPY